ncbi:MAG: alpha/beta fold hydrolase [Rhodobacteraceae bacterium]|nr:alpha/beta fold hydrolase [Paracoccaceae bacterium]
MFALDSDEDSLRHTATLDASVAYLNTSMAVLRAFDAMNARFEPEEARGARLRLVLNISGRVVWFNGHAQAVFNLSRMSSLAQLGLSAENEQRLEALLKQLDMPGPVVVPPVVLRLAGQTDEQCRYLIARQITQPEDDKLVLLEEMESSWTPMLAHMLQASFSLSVREVEIVEALSAGQTLAELSAMTGRQVSTLRTQLKSILRKTSTRSQAQLVRLVLSMASHAGAQPAAPEGLDPEAEFFTLPDGRILPYATFGPATGRPVLFVHGMLDGYSFLQDLDMLLSRAQLRIIAPERQGFGRAKLASTAEEAPDRFVADICALLDAMGIADLPVVGHMSGAVYAFAMAAYAPQRVRGVINVSGGVPIISLQQFRHMSARQRTVAFTARFAPAALPLVLHAGIRQIASGGIEAFVHSLYEGSMCDSVALSDPRIRARIIEGVRFATAQGYKGFEIDSFHVVRDWSEVIAASQCPVALIHGAHDPVVSVTSVQHLATRLGPRCTPIIAPLHGQTVLYAQPALLIEALVAMMALHNCR